MVSGEVVVGPSVRLLARKLTHEDKKIRDKGIGLLKRFLELNTDLSLSTYLMFCKGLFYCFWLSDKVLIQRELACEMTEFYLSVPFNRTTEWFACFYLILAQQWNFIDRHRLNKYLNFLRVLHRRLLESQMKAGWKDLLGVNRMLLTCGPLAYLDPPLIVCCKVAGTIPSLKTDDGSDELTDPSTTTLPPPRLYQMGSVVHSITCLKIANTPLRSILLSEYVAISPDQSFYQTLLHLTSSLHEANQFDNAGPDKLSSPNHLHHRLNKSKFQLFRNQLVEPHMRALASSYNQLSRFKVLGLTLQHCDVFLDELQNLIDHITPTVFEDLLDPYLKIALHGSDEAVVQRIIDRVLMGIAKDLKCKRYLPTVTSLLERSIQQMPGIRPFNMKLLKDCETKFRLACQISKLGTFEISAPPGSDATLVKETTVPSGQGGFPPPSAVIVSNKGIKKKKKVHAKRNNGGKAVRSRLQSCCGEPPTPGDHLVSVDDEFVLSEESKSTTLRSCLKASSLQSSLVRKSRGRLLTKLNTKKNARIAVSLDDPVAEAKKKERCKESKTVTFQDIRRIKRIKRKYERYDMEPRKMIRA